MCIFTCKRAQYTSLAESPIEFKHADTKWEKMAQLFMKQMDSLMSPEYVLTNPQLQIHDDNGFGRLRVHIICKYLDSIEIIFMITTTSIEYYLRVDTFLLRQLKADGIRLAELGTELLGGDPFIRYSGYFVGEPTEELVTEMAQEISRCAKHLYINSSVAGIETEKFHLNRVNAPVNGQTLMFDIPGMF